MSSLSWTHRTFKHLIMLTLPYIQLRSEVWAPWSRIQKTVFRGNFTNFFLGGGGRGGNFFPRGALPSTPTQPEALPPGPRWGASTLTLSSKVTSPCLQYHNCFNTAATQNLLTALKSMKPWQLNLFTSLRMILLNIKGSAGPFVYCTVLMCHTCSSCKLYVPALPLMCDIVPKWS